jgi:hypothetical protein
VKANAILEHYNPLIIEVMQQVRLEDLAVNNEVKLQNLLDICKKIIIRLIHDAEYKQLKPVTVTKIFETKYDANVIGWSMPLDLLYLKNENKDPCLTEDYVYLIDDFGNFITDEFGNAIILN